MTSVFEEFEWRGLVHSFTEGLPEALAREKVTAYIGFDPTASSLQVGNLLALMGLARMQRYGHTPIALAGGGTGMIGDPSGKTSERQLLNLEIVQANVEAIKPQLARFLDFDVKSNRAIIENNATWLTTVPMMDFLRTVGKHFTVNYMVAKDSVKSRLDREDGISYTEFSYMLLQAYDFQHLFERYGCRVQCGGSDQWGNITAGVELIRRALGERAYGLVYPLVTTADGSKLGKTASGTIWLDAQRTSPYRFYQYWLNQGDAEAVSYLKYFTWLSRAEIDDLEGKAREHPEEREAQRTLACELTRMVHGETALAKALQASGVLFGDEIAGLTADEVRDIMADVPVSQMARSQFEGDGMLVLDVLAETKVASSRGDARRLIDSGGIYVNNLRVADAGERTSLAHTIEGKFIVLRRGKKQYHLIELIR